MRHSDINLTMVTYTHVGLYDLNAAVECLPAFHLTPTPLAATGSTDAKPKTEQPRFPLVQNWHQANAIRSDSLRTGETSPRLETHFAENEKPRQLRGFEGVSDSLRVPESQSHRSDLNRGPMLYESIALPTELRWRTRLANSSRWKM